MCIRDSSYGPLYVSASTALTPPVKPDRSATSRSRPTPACETTPSPSALTLTRGTIAIVFTQKVPPRAGHGTSDKSYYPLRDRHFRLLRTRVDRSQTLK